MQQELVSLSAKNYADLRPRSEASAGRTSLVHVIMCVQFLWTLLLN